MCIRDRFSASLSAAGANASAYIASSASLKYREYRLELIREALNNPLITERIQNAKTVQEVNDILKDAIEDKLKKYREENALDENGEIKE